MRDMLLLLEAIRLEIRAAAAADATDHWKASGLRKSADKLAEMSFQNINLASDEKEALGHDQT